MAPAMVSTEAVTAGSTKLDHSRLLKHALHNNIYTNSSALQSEPSLNNNGLHDPAEFDERPPLTKINSSPATTTPISNPSVRSTRRRRLTFRPRMTPLDLANPESTNDQFRGFFTLFWLAMAFYVLQTVIRCYEQEGILLSLSFFRLFSKDGLALLVSDLTMVSMTLFSVPFSKLVLWGWLPYDSVGFYVQHLCQALFLFVNIYWTFWRYIPIALPVNPFILFTNAHPFLFVLSRQGLAVGPIWLLYPSYAGHDDENALLHFIEWRIDFEAKASQVSKETYSKMDCRAS